jgi:hypothetical protein
MERELQLLRRCRELTGSEIKELAADINHLLVNFVGEKV